MDFLFVVFSSNLLHDSKVEVIRKWAPAKATMMPALSCKMYPAGPVERDAQGAGTDSWGETGLSWIPWVFPTLSDHTPAWGP